MTNLEQVSVYKQNDHIVNLAKDTHIQDFGSTLYGAAALDDWKKTFVQNKAEYFKSVSPGSIDNPFASIDIPAPKGHLIAADQACKPVKQNDGLPEFAKRPADESKHGIEYAKEKARELLGLGPTMHDKVKELVVAGLTPEQRSAYLKEERDWKQNFGYGLESHSQKYIDFRNNPQGAMHDLVNKLTLAAEQKMAGMAKQGLSPAQVLKLERGLINGTNNEETDAYEQRLLHIVGTMDSKGQLPKDFATISESKTAQKRRDNSLLKQHCSHDAPWILKLTSW